MLYKIEFLTIENMSFKRDYEIFNFSDWRQALNRFIKLEKFYFPVYIFDIKTPSLYSNDHPISWSSVFTISNESVDEDAIIKLNVDLGYLQDYNDSGL